MPGLPGLDPTPRKRGLLSLRAVNSLKNVFGANQPAWLTLVKASTVNVSLTTAVTLTGRFAGSCGSFCAVTSIGGNVVVSGGVCAAAPNTEDTKDTKDTKEIRAELVTSFRCRAAFAKAPASFAEAQRR